MNQRVALGLAILAGFGLGAVAIQSLHAQAKPPVYYIGENDLTNPDGYAKEYLPHARELIIAAGGRYVAAGKATALDGAPPATRIVVLAFDNMEKLQAWRNSAEWKEHRKIGEKYAKFRAYAIDGTPQ